LSRLRNARRVLLIVSNSLFVERDAGDLKFLPKAIGTIHT
jgi:hypothetical protein